jgi:hypothetical protein
MWRTTTSNVLELANWQEFRISYSHSKMTDEEANAARVQPDRHHQKEGS